MNISIITHTGSDLPLVEAENLGVIIVPDIVIIDEKPYKNMVELTSGEFYSELRSATKLPTSSHPTIGDMADIFLEQSKEADEILFLAITSKMSGSYSAAVTAAEMAKRNGAEAPIYVYDTLQCSHAMGQMVREAKRLADEGLTATEIITKLDSYREKMGLYFILDTLKYARKGGRVGAIKALAADAMGIKPLLVFEKGVVRDIGIAKGFNDGLSKVLDRYIKEADYSKPVSIFHLDAEDKAELLSQKLREINPDVSIRTEYVGPVIGLYAGPGGAGLAFEKK